MFRSVKTAMYWVRLLVLTLRLIVLQTFVIDAWKLSNSTLAVFAILMTTVSTMVLMRTVTAMVLAMMLNCKLVLTLKIALAFHPISMVILFPILLIPTVMVTASIMCWMFSLMTLMNRLT